MRWKVDPLAKSKGERRTIRSFLFLPETYDGEGRWLEFAKIVQEVQELRTFGLYGHVVSVKHLWVSVSWEGNVG